MATTNPITGDTIQSKAQSKEFANNYDAIFRKDDNKQEHLNHLLKDGDMGFNTCTDTQ